MTDRASSDTTQPERPLTRAERREQTRALLIDAARMVFAEEGYHGANLERIAHVAGFSKGAVYSNFDGKAQLFLAVMDANLALLEGHTWDLFEDQSDGEEGASAEAPAASGEMTESEETAAMSGFALASLEFIAAAARDPELAPELAARGQLMVEAFTRVAEVSRDPDDPLSADELGALLSAFDQGMALLSLTGAGTIDTRHARLGLQRLVAPARAAAHGLAGSGPGTRAIHDRALQRRIMDDQG
jgi:AcrR family transcriptional regulator